MAVAESAVVIAAVGKDPGLGNVLAWRSVDQGKSWKNAPAPLNSEGNSAREGLHALAAGPKDAIFCAWLDLRNNRMEIYGSRSDDAGATWEHDQIVYRAPEKSVCNCCHPSVAFAPDGTLYVMLRNDVNGSRDMYFTRSQDGGKTFAPAEKLGKKTWKIAACPDGRGLDGNRQRRRAGLGLDAGFRGLPGTTRRAGGGPLAPASSPGQRVGHKGRSLVWLERRPGPVRALIDRSAKVILLDNAANDPVVASGAGGRGMVVAAWEKPGEGIRAQVLIPGGK